jgi:hypothetical protein
MYLLMEAGMEGKVEVELVPVVDRIQQRSG